MKKWQSSQPSVEAVIPLIATRCWHWETRIVALSSQTLIFRHENLFSFSAFNTNYDDDDEQMKSVITVDEAADS